jgi:hypothetical protein
MTGPAVVLTAAAQLDVVPPFDAPWLVRAWARWAAAQRPAQRAAPRGPACWCQLAYSGLPQPACTACVRRPNVGNERSRGQPPCAAPHAWPRTLCPQPWLRPFPFRQSVSLADFWARRWNNTGAAADMRGVALEEQWGQRAEGAHHTPWPLVSGQGLGFPGLRAAQGPKRRTHRWRAPTGQRSHAWAPPHAPGTRCDRPVREWARFPRPPAPPLLFARPLPIGSPISLFHPHPSRPHTPVNLL